MEGGVTGLVLSPKKYQFFDGFAHQEMLINVIYYGMLW